jgi:hypothetical protein
MQNIVMKREGNKLIIEIDLSQDLGPSGSGKTNIIASTRGNAPVPEMPEAFIGVNCYRYTTPKAKKPRP